MSSSGVDLSTNYSSKTFGFNIVKSLNGDPTQIALALSNLVKLSMSLIAMTMLALNMF